MSKGPQAVGLLEVYGLVTAFAASDAACKAANVTIESFDTNKPANVESLKVPLLVLVKLRGSIADIEAAIEAGEQAAMALGGVLSKHIIPRPMGDVEQMLKINALEAKK
ncbi:MAG: BMC domain-containing protein [Defluviitaleaceae bacterium]|nr:BMC domain-containing protein [Defluviitaleaceae bacterium]